MLFSVVYQTKWRIGVLLHLYSGELLLELHDWDVYICIPSSGQYVHSVRPSLQININWTLILIYYSKFKIDEVGLGFFWCLLTPYSFQLHFKPSGWFNSALVYDNHKEQIINTVTIWTEVVDTRLEENCCCRTYSVLRTSVYTYHRCLRPVCGGKLVEWSSGRIIQPQNSLIKQTSFQMWLRPDFVIGDSSWPKSLLMCDPFCHHKVKLLRTTFWL